MCVLTEKYTRRKSFTGYKLMGYRNGKYYSLGMGFQYHVGKRIPIIKKQRRICKMFSINILQNCFEENMKGRTCVFRSLTKATQFYNDHSTYVKNCDFIFGESKYKMVIVKVTLTKDLMIGYYDDGYFKIPVIGGRIIESIEEVGRN